MEIRFRFSVILILMFFIFSMTSLASDYNYIASAKIKKRYKVNRPYYNNITVFEDGLIIGDELYAHPKLLKENNRLKIVEKMSLHKVEKKVYRVPCSRNSKIIIFKVLGTEKYIPHTNNPMGFITHDKYVFQTEGRIYWLDLKNEKIKTLTDDNKVVLGEIDENNNTMVTEQTPGRLIYPKSYELATVNNDSIYFLSNDSYKNKLLGRSVYENSLWKMDINGDNKMPILTASEVGGNISAIGSNGDSILLLAHNFYVNLKDGQVLEKHEYDANGGTYDDVIKEYTETRLILYSLDRDELVEVKHLRYKEYVSSVSDNLNLLHINSKGKSFIYNFKKDEFYEIELEDNHSTYVSKWSPDSSTIAFISEYSDMNPQVIIGRVSENGVIQEKIHDIDRYLYLDIGNKAVTWIDDKSLIIFTKEGDEGKIFNIEEMK